MNVVILTLMIAGVFCASSPAHAVKFERGVPAAVSKQVSSDLNFMRNVRGAADASALHLSIFGGAVDGEVYLKWFDQRIRAFGYDSSKTVVLGASIAYNDSGFFKRKHMMVTNLFVKGKIPQIGRIVVLYHEARHSERENTSHVLCPSPYLDDDGRAIKSIFSGSDVSAQPACDDNYFGAYGSTVVLLKNLARFCTNCSEKVKMDAEIYADDQKYRMMNLSDRKFLLDDIAAALKTAQ